MSDNKVDFGSGNRMDGVSVDQSRGNTTGMTTAKKSIIGTVIAAVTALGGLGLEWGGVINFVKGFGDKPAAEVAPEDPGEPSP